MRERVLASTIGAALLLGMAAIPAAARDGRDARGGCSGGHSEWRLSVQREEAGLLRVRFRIEGSEGGHEWQLFVSNQGKRIYAGTKLSDDGGEVRLRLPTRDRRGRDHIAATGVDLTTGESCSGGLRI
jgi:hypothetical protein